LQKDAEDEPGVIGGDTASLNHAQRIILIAENSTTRCSSRLKVAQRHYDVDLRARLALTDGANDF
jgi:hypothetical protein